MEVLLFIVFVAVCAFLLFRVMGNSKKRVNPAHQEKLRGKQAHTRQLETPAVYTLSRPDQPWHTRRHPASTGVSRTNVFAPRSESAEPEYDGYSRRDRHHLTDRDAHIKDEAHLDDPKSGTGGTWGEQGLAH